MNPHTAQSLEELPDLEDLRSRTGLEFMQDVAAGRLSGPPIGETLGFGIASVEPGRVAFQGAAEFKVTNPMRGVHGGWYGALLDSCMGCAVMTVLEKGQAYTTLEYKVNFTRALPLGMRVEAVGRVSHAGRRTAVATGEIRGAEDGKLYASGSTTCLVMDLPPP